MLKKRGAPWWYFSELSVCHYSNISTLFRQYGSRWTSNNNLIYYKTQKRLGQYKIQKCYNTYMCWTYNQASSVEVRDVAYVQPRAWMSGCSAGGLAESNSSYALLPGVLSPLALIMWLSPHSHSRTSMARPIFWLRPPVLISAKMGRRCHCQPVIDHPWLAVADGILDCDPLQSNNVQICVWQLWLIRCDNCCLWKSHFTDVLSNFYSLIQKLHRHFFQKKISPISDWLLVGYLVINC